MVLLRREGVTSRDPEVRASETRGLRRAQGQMGASVTSSAWDAWVESGHGQLSCGPLGWHLRGGLSCDDLCHTHTGARPSESREDKEPRSGSLEAGPTSKVSLANLAGL